MIQVHRDKLNVKGIIYECSRYRCGQNGAVRRLRMETESVTSTFHRPRWWNITSTCNAEQDDTSWLGQIYSFLVIPSHFLSNSTQCAPLNLINRPHLFESKFPPSDLPYQPHAGRTLKNNLAPALFFSRLRSFSSLSRTRSKYTSLSIDMPFRIGSVHIVCIVGGSLRFLGRRLSYLRSGWSRDGRFTKKSMTDSTGVPFSRCEFWTGHREMKWRIYGVFYQAFSRDRADWDLCSLVYIYIYLFISLVSSTLCTGIVMIVVLGTKNKRLTFPLPFSSKVPTVSSLLFFSKCKYWKKQPRNSYGHITQLAQRRGTWARSAADIAYICEVLHPAGER